MTKAEDAVEPSPRRGKRKRRSRPVGKRRRAREMAVQMLYQHEIGESALDQVFDAFDADGYARETQIEAAGEDEPVKLSHPDKVREAFEYAQQLARGTLENGSTIDRRIREHAENWRLERMPVIDRNILRLAIYEMFHVSGVPKVVIVDEAIELAKKFGSEHSGRFVNGLLDGVLKAADQSSKSEMPTSAPTAGAGGKT